MSVNIDTISQSNLVQGLLKQVGVNKPPVLKRNRGQWEEELLAGREILIGGRGQFNHKLGKFLGKTGASFLLAPGVDQSSFADITHNNLQSLDFSDSFQRFQGIIFDCSGLEDVDSMTSLFHFFNKAIVALTPSSRIVILGIRPEEAPSQGHKIVAHAVKGFVRSMAKEMAPKGHSVQLLQVGNSDESLKRAVPCIKFFLSDFSSFITAQTIPITDEVKGTVKGNLSGSLAGKTALVTGAAGGIGKAVVEALFHEGCHVIALDRPETEASLTALAAKCEAHYSLVDLSDRDAAEKVIAYLKSKDTKLDIIVHNAGVTRDKTLKKMSEAHWNMVLTINLESVIRTNTALIENGLIADYGRIICMSSISGIAGNFGQTNYSTSKAGLIGHVAYLSENLKSQGITVNAIAPGFIETPMTDRVPFLTKQFSRRLAAFLQGGVPQDIAHALCFLSSSESQGINGVTLRVCGGHLMGV